MRLQLDTRSVVIASIVAACISAAIAAFVGWGVGNQNERVRTERFEAVVARAAFAIEQRVRLFEYGLRGARGAIVAGGGLAATRNRFNDYAETRDPDREFFGSRGFGFVRRVTPQAEPAFLEEMRRDRPNFVIRQFKPHGGERFVIAFLEPEGPNVSALGLDIASEPKRLQAAQDSVEAGEARITAPITLLQAERDLGRGFLILLPVYQPGAPIATRDDRERAAIGWSYTPVLIDEVFAGFDTNGGEFGFKLRDRTDTDTELFSLGDPRAGIGLGKKSEVTLYGRLWELEFWALPAFAEHLNQTAPGRAASLAFAVSMVVFVLLLVYIASSYRRLQAALDRSRLASIVDGSHDAVVGKTLDGIVTDWNSAAERLFGYTAAEAIGRSASDLVVMDDQKAEETATIKRVRAGQRVEPFRTLRKTKSGLLLPMTVSLSPIGGPDGKLVGISVIVRDISRDVAAETRIRELNSDLERQVAERTAELRRSAALQSAILHHANSAIIATRPDGIITLFNPAAERMLGYACDEVVGKLTPVVFHDPKALAERADAMSREFGETFEPSFDLLVARAGKGQEEINDVDYMRRDGTRVPVRIYGSQLLSADGEPLGFIGIVTDLTQQIAYQDELVAAKLAAEQATEAKAAFLATMSHELRTPLNSIIGFSGLLLDSEEVRAGTAERHALLVHQASKTLLSIVNDVLDVSKLEAGRVDVDVAPFSPSHLITSTAALLQADADSRGVALVVEVPADLPTHLLGDEPRLRQILINLVSNALKFTREGEVTISVGATPLAGDGSPLHVRFSIRDTGIGIPESKQPRLFQRFNQVDSSTSRLYGGTGLGLSICKSLVDLMGGEIGFSSQEGRGSTFWFAVPLQEGQNVSVTEEANPDVAEARSRPRHILLAEDVEANRELAVALLSKWGHRVDIAVDGLEAVAAVQQTSYDLVLMDIQMPRMDGIEAAQHIRALGGSFVDLPIVAMTANVFRDDLDRFAAAGMNGRVSKPFVPAELRRMVDLWGGRSDQEAAASEPEGPEIVPTPDDMPQAEGSSCPRMRVDEEKLAQLEGAIGSEKVASIARRFAEDLQSRFSDTADRDALRRNAHAIASTSGMIGLTRLSEAARELEDACRGGADISDVLSVFLDLMRQSDAIIIERFGECTAA